jgi:hypothetical protein
VPGLVKVPPDPSETSAGDKAQAEMVNGGTTTGACVLSLFFNDLLQVVLRTKPIACLCASVLSFFY